ncbi:MAG: hypothetical protein KC492_16330, partial [Myxococcales bacterium]|nr:hypothetical protein [Myxococcales bacterium]
MLGSRTLHGRARWLLTLALTGVGAFAQGSNTAEAKNVPPKPTWTATIGSPTHSAGFWEAASTARFEAFNGARITLHPFAGQPARVRLMNERQRMMIDGKMRVLAMLYVDQGRVEVNTVATDAHVLLFSSHRGIAVSYGGRMEALVEGEYASFANRSGNVLTSTGRRYSPLATNRIKSFNSAIPEGSESSLLAPPKTVSAERQLYAVTSAPVQLAGLSWSPAEKAKGFEVRLTGSDVRYTV